MFERNRVTHHGGLTATRVFIDDFDGRAIRNWEPAISSQRSAVSEVKSNTNIKSNRKIKIYR